MRLLRSLATRRVKRTTLVFVAVASACGAPRAHAQDAPSSDKRAMGEPRPGEALVYVIRQSAFTARGAGFKVFSDDRLLAKLRNNTYTFAYLSPGTHIVWVEYSDAAPFDVAAGQTYYLTFKGVDPLKVVSEAEAQAAIAKASRFIGPNEEDLREAAGTIAKKWPKYRLKAASWAAPASEAPAYIPPVSTENMLRVPAGTALAAELMENLSSGLNQVNDAVWVRALADVSVDGRLFVAKGAPIKASIRGVKERERGNRQGRLDLVMTSVQAADGTVCPLIGQLASVGNQGSTGRNVAAGAVTGLQVAGLVAGALPGLLGGLLVPSGTDTYHLAGEKIRVFTREDVWIGPPDAGVADDVGAVTGQPTDVRKAHPRGNHIRLDVPKAKVPESVEIVVEGPSDAASLEMVLVDGADAPVPVRAEQLSRADEGWVARFDGWSICRYLRPGEAGTDLTFRLAATDGTVTLAQARLTLAGNE
jgi:hypothetical protein